MLQDVEPSGPIEVQSADYSEKPFHIAKEVDTSKGPVCFGIPVLALLPIVAYPVQLPSLSFHGLGPSHAISFQFIPSCSSWGHHM